MKRKSSAHTHREIARAYLEADRILRKLEGKSETSPILDRLKAAIYALFMFALPYLLTMLIWILIVISIHRYLLP